MNIGWSNNLMSQVSLGQRWQRAPDIALVLEVNGEVHEVKPATRLQQRVSLSLFIASKGQVRKNRSSIFPLEKNPRQVAWKSWNMGWCYPQHPSSWHLSIKTIQPWEYTQGENLRFWDPRLARKLQAQLLDQHLSGVPGASDNWQFYAPCKIFFLDIWWYIL